MLKRLTDQTAYSDPSEAVAAAPAFDISELVGTLLRQWPLIVAVAGAFAFGALAFIVATPARYGATASMMLDTRKNQVLQQQLVVGDLQVDPGVVDSQVEVLKSDSVAVTVVRNLSLASDPEFNGSQSGNVLRRWASALFDGTPLSETDKERNAVGYLQKYLTIKRVGTSYVMDITFASLDSAKAARVANAVTDAYVTGELDARFQATRRASRWLQDRIAELRVQAAAADAAVQKFKADNNIIDTGRGLMNDQQLVDVNTQLAAARAATAEAKARLDRMEEIARQDVPDATVADALRNDVISRLRAQYLDLSARAADFSQRFGANHGATVNLRNQMREIRRSMADELRRIGETYKSDYEIARAREASLDQSLAGLVTQSNVTSEAQIRLRDLESTALSYRNLYDNFLQRFMEATQQQSFAVNEARIITEATDQQLKVWPKTGLMLGGGLAFGLLVGAAGAILREKLDNNFRTVAQVERVAGIECLGVLPVIAAVQLTQPAAAPPGERRITRNIGMLRYVVDSPFTRFTETLRSAKVTLDIRRLDQRTQVIGIVSALPNEGKTTIAANMSNLVASTGHRTLLIDADLRNPSLTRAAIPEAERGLVDVLTGKCLESEVIWKDPVTGLHILPAATDGTLPNTAELVSSVAMAGMLDRLRSQYDYIFLDLPPIAPIVDVRAATHLIDGLLLVIEWGRTSKDIIAEVIGEDDIIRGAAIGAVLNKANRIALRRLESYKGRYYSNYYREQTKA